MDKVIFVAGTLYFLADVFVIACIARDDWINTESELGKITVGLLRQCQDTYLRGEVCFDTEVTKSCEACFVFLLFALCGFSVALCVAVRAHWNRAILVFARDAAYLGVMCLAFVGLIFPLGYSRDIVGGTPMRLPSHWKVGDSYRVLWVLSIAAGFSGWVVLTLPMQNIFN